MLDRIRKRLAANAKRAKEPTTTQLDLRSLVETAGKQMSQRLLALALLVVAASWRPTDPVDAYSFCHPIFHPCDIRAYLPFLVRELPPTPVPPTTTPIPPTPTPFPPTNTIPPPPPTAAPPTAVPRPLHVMQTVHWGADKDGDITFWGEVLNTTDHIAPYVDVAVNVRDRGGNVLDTASSWVKATHLLPGNNSCFEIRLGGPMPRGWSGYDFEVSSSTYGGTLAVLPVINHRGYSERGYDGRYAYVVVGELRNDHAVAVRDAYAVITAYAAAQFQGNVVVGCERAGTSVSNLAPGQRSSFKAEFSGYKHDYVDVVRYRVEGYASP